MDKGYSFKMDLARLNHLMTPRERKRVEKGDLEAWLLIVECSLVGSDGEYLPRKEAHEIACSMTIVEFDRVMKIVGKQLQDQTKKMKNSVTSRWGRR